MRQLVFRSKAMQFLDLNRQSEKIYNLIKRVVLRLGFVILIE